MLRGRNLSRELVPRGRAETQRSVYPDADRHGARSPGGRLLRHRAARRHGRPGGDRRGQCDLHSDPDHDAGPRAHVAPRSRRVGGGVGPAGHLGILDGVEPGDGADARVLAGQPCTSRRAPRAARARYRWGHGRRRPLSSPTGAISRPGRSPCRPWRRAATTSSSGPMPRARSTRRTTTIAAWPFRSRSRRPISCRRRCRRRHRR